MSGGESGLPWSRETDTCTLAILLGSVTGLAAVAEPWLSSLSFVLVALGIAAFLMGYRPRHGGRLTVDGRTALALSLLALGLFGYFFAPSAVTPFGPLLLAASAGPLAYLHRTRRPVLSAPMGEGP